MNFKNFIFIFLVSIFCTLSVNAYSTYALMDWKGQNPLNGAGCQFQVFDLGLTPEGEVQFQTQIKFEEPFYISPQIWIRHSGGHGDHYSGSSSNGEVLVELYTTSPDVGLPYIETIKVVFNGGTKPTSLKCSTPEE